MLPLIGGLAAGIGSALPSITGALGADADRKAQAKMNAANLKAQKEFAQMGVRWRVADAEAAGIHPLAALGAATPGFAPSFSVGGVSEERTMSDMGQNVSRAIQAGLTKEERFASKSQELQLENMGLQNDLLRGQVLSQQRSQLGPGLPSAVDAGALPGQGDAYQVNPALLTASSRGAAHQEAGAINSVGFARTASGGLTPVPSKDVKERIEDDFVQQIGWAVRNQLVPALSGLPPPDPRQYPLPKGYNEWRWHPVRQEFIPARRGAKTKKWEWE